MAGRNCGWSKQAAPTASRCRCWRDCEREKRWRSIPVAACGKGRGGGRLRFDGERPTKPETSNFKPQTSEKLQNPNSNHYSDGPRFEIWSLVAPLALDV